MSPNDKSTSAALGGVITQKPFRHGNWLEIHKPNNDLHCAQLVSDAPEPEVAMTQYLGSGGAVEDNEFIVVNQYVNTHCIQLVRAGSKELKLDASYLLEDLGQGKRTDEKIARLENWKALAVLSGAMLTTPTGGRPTEQILARLKAVPDAIAEAIALRHKWPHPFRIVSGRPADLLIDHAGLKIDANGNVCPADGESSPGLQPTAVSLPVAEAGPPQAELIGLPQNKPVQAEKVKEAKEAQEAQVPAASNEQKPIFTSEREHAMEQPSHQPSQPAGPTPSDTSAIIHLNESGLGDRLEPPFDSVMRSGLYPPNFTYQGHHLRANANWAVIMHVPDTRRGKYGMDCMICTISDASRYAKENSCVLRIGTGNEGLPVATPEVRMWKAVAACFGMYAVANQDLQPEPLTHGRTQRMIHRFKDKIMDAIELWPIAAHQSLKPIAKARALAVLQGRVPVKLDKAGDGESADENLNGAEANQSAQGANHGLPASTPAGGVAGANQFEHMATPGTPVPLRQRTPRATARQPVDTIESMLERARASNEAVVTALVQEVQTSEAKLATKAQLIDKLSAELAEETQKAAQLKANLAKFKRLVEDSPLDSAAA